jgi:hypothetical protein
LIGRVARRHASSPIRSDLECRRTWSLTLSKRSR